MTYKEYLLEFVGKSGEHYREKGVTILVFGGRAEQQVTGMIEAVYDDFVTIKYFRTKQIYNPPEIALEAIPFSRVDIQTIKY